MPIANSFLSNHRIINVKNPSFSSLKEIPTMGSSFFEIVCKTFTSQVQMNTSNKVLIQDWPAAKYLDIKPFVYITKIEMPILLDKNGIRTNELSFFNNWLFYMLSTFDTIKGTNYTLSSLIVENASIRVNENDVILSLSFKSNFPLDWGPSGFGNSLSKTLHARKAVYYDSFVKFNKYTDSAVTSNKILGWDNKYGVSNFQVEYQSETEEICLSMHEFNSSMTIGSTTLSYPNLTDMINVKNVNYNGQISFFGPEMEIMGTSPQVSGSNNFQPLSQDIFSMALNAGGIQLYVGGLDLNATSTVYTLLTPLTFLPTGTMISNASTEFSGGQVYKHTRQFFGVFTNTPKKVLQDGYVIETQLE